MVKGGKLSHSGSAILKRVARLEDKCEKSTLKNLPKLGSRAPLAYEHLGELLAFADLIGSCNYSCPGNKPGEHALWYLIARVSSFGRAALRLTMMGFYDEALIIVRSVGEITNLLTLFSLSPESIQEWKASDRQHRIEQLSPGKVRKRITALGGMSPIDFDRYVKLCELCTHPVPTLSPQRFNPQGKSMTGGIIPQFTGLCVVLNEMILAVAPAVVFAAKICKVNDDAFKEIERSAVAALRAAGGINLANFNDLLDDAAKSHSVNHVDQR
jgi:hypothetical protein